MRQALKDGKIEEARTLLYELHSTVHSTEIYQTPSPTYQDEIWKNLSEKAFRTMPSIKDVTIAWNIWHITRIEDITANILIADTNQILEDKCLCKLNIGIKDTGNAMSDE